MITQDQNKSIATGADLNPETWSDFVARLHHDCVGKGVDDHCTAEDCYAKFGDIYERKFRKIPV